MRFASHGKQVQALLSSQDAPLAVTDAQAPADSAPSQPQGTSLFGQLLGRLLGDGSAPQPHVPAPVREPVPANRPVSSSDDIQWD